MAKNKVTGDIYFKILELLLENGIYRLYDISGELKTYFKATFSKEGMTDKPLEVYFYDTAYDNVEDLLKGIKEEGHINYKNDTPNLRVIEDSNWPDKINVSASITAKGYLFLYEKKKFNEMVRGNKLTRYFIGATILIGIGTGYISYLNHELSKSHQHDMRKLLHQSSYKSSKADTVKPQLKQNVQTNPSKSKSP